MSSDRRDDVPALTEGIRPGTATDPDVGAETEATVSVDGREVTVGPGATLLDAVEAAATEAYVPALCSYGDEELIGPRSECRTCMVETDAHGLVPACSHPAEDGLSVETDAERATEARDVNLDLVLSDHNLRCTTCGKNGRCELQDVAIENDVEEPRYGVLDDRDAYEPLDDSTSFIQIDRNKCILCNRCVEACNDVQVEGVLRLEGSGEDTRIGFQNGAETMADSTCVSCGHCVTVCPTGSLVEKGLEDVATLGIPGFSHENSIGSKLESSGEDGRLMTPMKSEDGDDRQDTKTDGGTGEKPIKIGGLPQESDSRSGGLPEDNNGRSGGLPEDNNGRSGEFPEESDARSGGGDARFENDDGTGWLDGVDGDPWSDAPQEESGGDQDV